MPFSYFTAQKRLIYVLLSCGLNHPVVYCYMDTYANILALEESHRLFNKMKHIVAKNLQKP